MKYEIIKKSWSKRRKLDNENEINTIQLINFVKQHNHFCQMQVNYSNGEEAMLVSRVVYNDIKKHWTVDGMKVVVRIID